MRRSTKWLIAAGSASLLITLAWTPLVVPQLVRLPANLDVTTHYTGTFSTFMDQSTGMPLTQPVHVPMTIDRHVFGLKGQSGAHRALISEEITMRAGDRVQVQKAVYAVDRRSMKNDADGRAFTYTPGTVVDRSGSYFLTLPMGFDPGAGLQIWNAQTGTTYTMTSGTPLHEKIDGLRVTNLTGVMKDRPVASYETAALRSQGLPMDMAPAQATALLTAMGADIPGALSAISAAAPAATASAVTTALTSPVPLRYHAYTWGNAAAEPKTGSIVKLAGVTDGIAVKADSAAIQPVIAALQPYQSSAAVTATVAALEKVAAMAPLQVFELHYDQTPASVAAAVDDARSMANRKTLVERDLTAALIVLTAGLLAAGLATALVPRPTPSAEEARIAHLPQPQPFDHAA